MEDRVLIVENDEEEVKAGHNRGCNDDVLLRNTKCKQEGEYACEGGWKDERNMAHGAEKNNTSRQNKHPTRGKTKARLIEGTSD